MGQRFVTKAELQTWVDPYIASITNDPNETKNAIISLKELRDLMTYIDNANVNLSKRIDGIRIYLTRFPLMSTTRTTNRNGPQISIAIVPTVEYSEQFEIDKQMGVLVAGAKNHYVWDNTVEQIMCVFPGDVKSEHTGLCPVNCGGSLIP